MKSILKKWFGLIFCLFLGIFFCFDSIDSKQFFITADVDFERNQNSIASKSIDDLLGPDIDFPFDPANHRDGSNPIKRIGKISDDNL
tara:strand:- start:384 stop:644 length:261 start_codon:yes stop_codon:yes gene_type:complete